MLSETATWVLSQTGKYTMIVALIAVLVLMATHHARLAFAAAAVALMGAGLHVAPWFFQAPAEQCYRQFCAATPFVPDDYVVGFWLAAALVAGGGMITAYMA